MYKQMEVDREKSQEELQVTIVKARCFLAHWLLARQEELEIKYPFLYIWDEHLTPEEKEEKKKQVPLHAENTSACADECLLGVLERSRRYCCR